MALFNVQQFRSLFIPAVTTRLEPIAYTRALASFNAAKTKMLEEFNSHDVTQEIEGGADAKNISNTLEGVEGNLFSFIGFYEGESPTQVVREVLVELTKLRAKPKVSRRPQMVIYKFEVRVPTLLEIEALTPMHWEPRSWVRGIEQGISGLGYYLFLTEKMRARQRSFPQSRSGLAIQIKNSLRAAKFRNTKYMSSILNNFRERI